MGIENWLYQHLGSPAIIVIGEVATPLKPEAPVTWINTTAPDAAATRGESAAGVGVRAKVLLKGGCDLIQVDDFLAGSLKTELSYTNDNGSYIEWHRIEVTRWFGYFALLACGLARSEYCSRPGCGGLVLFRLDKSPIFPTIGQYSS